MRFSGSRAILRVVSIVSAVLFVTAVFAAPILRTLDSTGDVGQYTSIAIGSDGFPVISYYAPTGSDLKFIACGDATCSAGNTITTLDSSGNVGLHTSVAFSNDGFPVIAYFDITNGDLKVLFCGNATCSAGNSSTTLDSTGEVGRHASLAIGNDGFPVISYYNSTNADLKVVACGDATCSAGNTITTLDSSGNVGQYTSIVIGDSGFPVIAYQDVTNGDLQLVVCGNATCSADNVIRILDSSGIVGSHLSLALGEDGFPVISYYDATNTVLKVIVCGDATCSSGNTIATPGSDDDITLYTSVAIGNDGFPVISYYELNNEELKMVVCGDATCSAGNTVTVVDADGNVGGFTSIAVGNDGVPVISYYDGTNGDLKLAVCDEAVCPAGEEEEGDGGGEQESSRTGGAWAHRQRRLRYAEIARGDLTSPDDFSDTVPPAPEEVGIFRSSAGRTATGTVLRPAEDAEPGEEPLPRRVERARSAVQEQQQPEEKPQQHAPFRIRVCARVTRWFSGAAFDRVDARILRRLGFSCR